MNWEAMGAIGESIGAIGVILTLVYLARQIRHSADQTSLNTKSVQASAYQQLIDHHTQLNQNLTTNTELFGILVRAEQEGLNNLSAMDRNRWEVFISSMLRSYLNAHYLRKGELISDEQYANFTFGLGTLAARSEFNKWWRSERGRREFPADFVATVDRLASNLSANSAPHSQ